MAKNLLTTDATQSPVLVKFHLCVFSKNRTDLFFRQAQQPRGENKSVLFFKLDQCPAAEGLILTHSGGVD